MNIYVASSWRNTAQPRVVELLRSYGHEVYDFKNTPKSVGFDWKEIDPSWKLWSAYSFKKGLKHPRAQEAFKSDMDALEACNVCVCVLPCGRSAHLELGWAAGAGKRTIVLLDDPISEPELMYLMNTSVCANLGEAIALLRAWDEEAKKKIA